MVVEAFLALSPMGCHFGHGDSRLESVAAFAESEAAAQVVRRTARIHLISSLIPLDSCCCVLRCNLNCDVLSLLLKWECTAHWHWRTSATIEFMIKAIRVLLSTVVLVLTHSVSKTNAGCLPRFAVTRFSSTSTTLYAVRSLLVGALNAVTHRHTLDRHHSQ